MYRDIEFKINGQKVKVAWEQNEAVTSLSELLTRRGPITVKTSRYGGFEQVGPLPGSLDHHDTQLTSHPGDIFLYQGNQVVVFFGSNSWSYTRLGHITAPAGSALVQLLNQSGVELTFSLS